MAHACSMVGSSVSTVQRLSMSSFRRETLSNSTPSHFAGVSWGQESGVSYRRGLAARESANGVVTEDCYKTLGVGPSASKTEIKKAYRLLALKFHPDVCRDKDCETKFQQIHRAYEDILNGEAQWEFREVEGESFMGVGDNSWEDWEDWMGWEGAGTLDYSNHINRNFCN